MRRREISPEFWRDERVWALSDPAKLLLPGIWQLADRAGRLLDKPFNIGVECRPWDVPSVAGLLNEIVATGLLVRYEVDGVPLLAVPPKAWKTHQHPHPKEVDSKLPGIPRETAEGTTRGAPRSDPGSTKEVPNQSGSSGLQDLRDLQAFKPSGPSGSSWVAPVAAVKKPKKPKAQTELPEIIPPPPPPPPREPTRVEILFGRWEFFREEHLEGLGAPALDAGYGWAQIGKTFRRWLDLWPDVPLPTKADELGVVSGAEFRIQRLFEAYLELDWPAKCTARDRSGTDTGVLQPWPFSALSSEKVWGDLVAKLWPDEPYALAWPERKLELERKGAA